MQFISLFYEFKHVLELWLGSPVILGMFTIAIAKGKAASLCNLYTELFFHSENCSFYVSRSTSVIKINPLLFKCIFDFVITKASDQRLHKSSIRPCTLNHDKERAG